MTGTGTRTGEDEARPSRADPSGSAIRRRIGGRGRRATGGRRTLRSGAVGGRRGGQPTLEWSGVARAGSSSQVSLPVRPVGSGARLVSSNRTARREGQTSGRATQVDATAQCNGTWWAERERDAEQVTLTGRWCGLDTQSDRQPAQRERRYEGAAGLPRSLEIQSISLAETLEKGNATSLARNVLYT